MKNSLPETSPFFARDLSMHPPGLYALVQDVGSAFAHPRAYFAGRHQKRDHRPGFRP
ncbi:protocatechuate 3,4-dioxygenase, beta subunit [Brucella abortus]|nr:hypothetical protein [Brucella abortus]AIJ62293.1 protocatechuate 3,4-dioxygenase, beta subunit [Brucella abortus bv. 9 str. C68]AIJ65117.1 protocatechuate 3,4-dioxygenase, beta subunit [Brucella abortus bv. 6 str. 870]AIJ58974.1 protocatechuate 3,4-dioxygenase, beta subunit [Brucella abortus]AIJ79035.1 protocatechuate 3,4-dioxygenase, beta subunit [Brucella abortus]AIK05529.1 protocatechuate 3,4-dioxygenase, beta subunit [Brucella abortus]